MYTHLITVDELQQLQASPSPLLVFDCSFELAEPSRGRALFEQQHVVGAVFADLDQDLSSFDPQTAVNGGRHPLPTREVFAQTLCRLGLDDGMQAVAYDRAGGAMAARMWWMLKWAGHDAAALLDGGLQAWTAAGAATESGPAPARRSGHFTLHEELRHWVSTEQVRQHLGAAAQTLIDARSPERFRGEVEPLDPVAGHIPGALNRHGSQNLTADGHFKPAAELRREFDAVLHGRDPATIVHQCGSGVYAAFNLFAAELAGYPPVPIYAGSWSEWCRTPGLPTERG